MKNLLELYDFAETEGIDVDWFNMPLADSLSIILPGGSCCIAIDPWKVHTLSEEIVALGHELGHCETGSFYNEYTPFDIRQKHENQADKWAIEHLISADDLDQAVANGYTTIWSLAEYFNVTEDFMRKVVCWYTHGNFAAELYF